MRPVRAGSYDQVGTLIDIPEATTDSYGQPSLAGTPIATLAVSIRPLQGEEQLYERQIYPTVTHIIKLPYTWNAIPPSADNPNGLIVPNMQFKVQKSADAAPRFYNVLLAENVEEANVEWVCRAVEKIGATS
jgi:hypothetical protein